MTQRFFTDHDGNYLGSYDGPDEFMPEKMAAGLEVPTPPEDARQVWKDGAWQPYEPPAPVSVLYPVHLWERMTETEADQVGTVMSQQSFRVRKIFESASSYRSDHELWPLLNQIATQLFGADRAEQILAPSELIPA